MQLYQDRICNYVGHFHSQSHTAVNKKPMKESSRWQQQSSSSHHSHQTPKQSDSDGGWSRGKPEKGSGWNRKNIQYSASASESMDKYTSHSWDISPSGDEVKDSVSQSNWPTTDSKQTGNWMLSPDSHSADNDEESRSQSPGGLVMRSLRGETEVKGSFFSSANDSNATGVSHWGAQNPSSEVVGSNWKLDVSAEDSEEEVANIMTDTYSKRHFRGDGRNDKQYEWSGTSNGLSDVDHSYQKSRATSSIMSNHSSLNKPRNEPYNGHENHDSNDSQEELGYKGSSMDDGTETPIRCCSRSSGGGTTPTGKQQQDSGGRASVGSTSSGNSVSSNSSWNSDGKGNKSNSNRSSSPRKPTR